MVVRVPDSYEVLPGVRSGRVTDPQSGPNGMQIVGRQSQEIGRAVQGAAGVAADIVRQEQEKQNKLRVNDAYNQARAAAHALRHDPNKGYQRLKGADAVKGITGGDNVTRPLTDYYDEELNKQLSDIRKTLGNDAVAAQFDLLSSDLRTGFRNEALTYEAQQASVYAVQVHDATIIQAGNDLAVNPLGPSSGVYVNSVRLAAEAKADEAGLDGDMRKQAVNATLGKVHSAVIDAMLERKDTAGAKAYFAAHKADFMELDAQGVAAKLDTAGKATQAIDAVDGVWADMGPRGINQPANKSAMDKALRDQFKDDPEALKAARSELAQRVGDWEFQENERNAGYVSTVWGGFLSGQSLASLEGSSAWLALPGDKRAQLKAQMENHAAGAEVSAEAWGSWLEQMYDEQYLLKATPAQIAALEPVYGRQLTRQLGAAAAAAKATLQKGAAASAKVDRDTFTSIAVEFGYDPYAKTDTSSGRQKRADAAAMLSYIEKSIEDQQRATGKIIPPGEVRDIVRRLAAIYTMRSKTGQELGINVPSDSALAQTARGLMENRGDEPTQENYRKALLDVFEAGAYLVDE